MSKGQAQLKRLTDTQARAYMERIRWPHGPQCPTCSSFSHHTLGGRARKRGLYQCKDCKKLYTVTMNTVMHGSKVNLWKWVYGVIECNGPDEAYTTWMDLRTAYTGAYFGQ